MAQDDREYYYQRAEAQLAMAQVSEVPEAVRAHYILAGYYLDRTYDQSGAFDVGETADSAAILAIFKGEDDCAAQYPQTAL